MARQDAKDRLVDFLDRRAFRPVLSASPDRYGSDADRQRLRHAQDATRRQQQRYHDEYTSAEEVVSRFRADLSSEPARGIHDDLHYLDLPALPDIKDDFDSFAHDLGVRD